MKRAILGCFALVSLAAGAVFAADRPNVLLICIDDLKPLLGCYGSPVIQSPNIDRLAARGVLFERAYCNQAVCSPSRNALLTSMRPQRLGIYDLATNFRKAAPDAVTLPQYFKQNGYRTEAMGKIFHVGHGNIEDEASWTVPHWRPAAGMYVLPANLDAFKKKRSDLIAEGVPAVKVSTMVKGPPTECADMPDSAYSDAQIADEAVKRLDAAAKKPNDRFFLAVGFLKPHLPFVAPKKYWDLYKPSMFKVPEVRTPPKGAPDFAPSTWGELRAYTDIPKIGPVTDETAIHLIHGYHAATTFMDAQLGRVLDALDRNGFGKNTIIVLWGDHGWHLGDHGMWCKHTNYEQAARQPVIVASPGVKGGVKTGSLIEAVDIYPTVCELAGLPAPKDLDGASFAAILKDTKTRLKDHVLHVYPRQILGRAVRTERYRLVEWKKIGAPAESAILELYDYEKDPDETVNIAEANPKVVAELRAMLAKEPEAKPQIGGDPAAKPKPKAKQAAKKPAKK